MMKWFSIGVLLVSLVGCSWLGHAVERMTSSGGDTLSVATNGQVQQKAVVEFERELVPHSDGTYTYEADTSQPVAWFWFRSEDGSSPVRVRCPQEQLAFCLELEPGEWVKLSGLLSIQGGRKIHATYVKRK